MIQFFLGLRVFVRNLRFAIVNLAGLSIALAVAFMIALYVLHERSYDSWLADHEDIFLITTEFVVSGRPPIALAPSPFPLRDRLKERFSEVEQAVRLFPQELPVRIDDFPVSESVALVDPNFFDVFGLPAFRGDPQHALQDISNIVVTKAVAHRWFGRADVVGKTSFITLAGEERLFRIAAVLHDLPPNTHLSHEIFLPLDKAFFPDDGVSLTDWGNVSALHYFKRNRKFDLTGLRAEVEDLVNAYHTAQYPEAVASSGAHFRFSFVPLKDVHLVGKGLGGVSDKVPGDPQLLAALSIAVVLVLAMAVINYTNLATALAMRRTREVALKRMFGASSRRILGEYFGESFLIVCFAAFLAWVLIELTFPFFIDFLAVELVFDDLVTWRSFALVSTSVPIVALLAGVYPVSAMGRVKPIHLFADQTRVKGGIVAPIRTAMVVFQISVSIALVAVTFVIFTQMAYLRDSHADFNPENLMVVRGLDNPGASVDTDALEQIFATVPNVTSVSFAQSAPGASAVRGNVLWRQGEEESDGIGVRPIQIAPRFFETMQVSPIAGRILGEELASDSYDLSANEGFNIILNRTAARQLGYRSPEDVIGEHLTVDRIKEGQFTATVIGIVPDLKFDGPREPSGPVYYLQSKKGLRLATVRFNGTSASQMREILRERWSQIFPETVFDAYYMPDALAKATTLERSQASLLAVMAVLSLLIASVGIYGIASFNAQRRAREIAVRRLFGASAQSLLAYIGANFVRYIVFAVLIGVPVAWLYSSHWLEQYPDRVAHGPGAYVAAIIGVSFLVIASVLAEVQKAVRRSPLDTLRAD